jgi:hypothetical protein
MADAGELQEKREQQSKAPEMEPSSSSRNIFKEEDEQFQISVELFEEWEEDRALSLNPPPHFRDVLHDFNESVRLVGVGPSTDSDKLLEILKRALDREVTERRAKPSAHVNRIRLNKKGEDEQCPPLLEYDVETGCRREAKRFKSK